MLHILLATVLALATAQTAPQTARTAPKTAQTAPTAPYVQGKVGRVQGKLVFCFNEPAAAYDIIFRITPAPLRPGLGLVDLLGQCVSSATAQGQPYDAVVVQEGQQLAIRFRPGTSPAQRELANVARMGGTYFYLNAEPVAPYHVALRHALSWSSPDVPGVYFTLGHVLENLLETSKHLANSQAIIVGNTASYISFTH